MLGVCGCATFEATESSLAMEVLLNVRLVSVFSLAVLVAWFSVLLVLTLVGVESSDLLLAGGVERDSLVLVVDGLAVFYDLECTSEL